MALPAIGGLLLVDLLVYVLDGVEFFGEIICSNKLKKSAIQTKRIVIICPDSLIILDFKTNGLSFSSNINFKLTIN